MVCPKQLHFEVGGQLIYIAKAKQKQATMQPYMHACVYALAKSII